MGIPSRSGVVTKDLQSTQSITCSTALACVLVYSHPRSAVEGNMLEYHRSSDKLAATAAGPSL